MRPRAQALGFLSKPGFKPQRGGRQSIPNVTLVVRDLVLLQKRHKLLLKRTPLVMFLLRRNILGDRRNVRFANAEYAIPSLPREFSVAFLSDPSRRIRLDDACDLGNGIGGTNTYQHMHVIAGPVND